MPCDEVGDYGYQVHVTVTHRIHTSLRNHKRRHLRSASQVPPSSAHPPPTRLVRLPVRISIGTLRLTRDPKLTH